MNLASNHDYNHGAIIRIYMDINKVLLLLNEHGDIHTYIHGSQSNNADQLSSQFVTSVQVIPAKIVLVNCIHTIGLSIKR